MGLFGKPALDVGSKLAPHCCFLDVGGIYDFSFDNQFEFCILLSDSDKIGSKLRLVPVSYCKKGSDN